MLIACVLLRGDVEYGSVAIVFLFAIVWTTDILGYFVGRFVGGPKLWPRVSPKKTWSGAIGGAGGAVIAGLAVAHYAHVANPLAVGALALVLSAASQGGDLFESAFKRRFGVKDAGHVIPGHGGIMDRLDGFLAAVVVAAIIGVGRGGLDAPARGLLMW
jgi:phosphatidate cytidylyltransferase